MATTFTPTGQGGTNIPISNGSNQIYGTVDYGNLFLATFNKPEWDNIIHKRFDEAKFAYIMDKVLQEEKPLIGNVFNWSEMGHTQRYNTAEAVTVNGTEAEVDIPNSETQLFGIGSVIMSKSNRQYKVVGFENGTYTLETLDGQNAAASDFGDTVSEEYQAGLMWHLYDSSDACGPLVKGAVPVPDKYEAWVQIIPTVVKYCYDEMTQPVWIGNGLYYMEAQANKITEHQMEKEKYVIFSEGDQTTSSNFGSTPGIISQLFTYGTSFSTPGAITDTVLVDYDALLKTNGGGRGEYIVLCSHIKMAEVTQAMRQYRVQSYNGMMNDVMKGKFTIEFESIKINGCIYHFIPYDFFSFAPTNETSNIDYNNLLVFICMGENGGREKLLTIKYTASFMPGSPKENTRLSMKPSPTTPQNGVFVLDERCHEEAITSKFALIFKKRSKSGLLITTTA